MTIYLAPQVCSNYQAVSVYCTDMGDRANSVGPRKHVRLHASFRLRLDARPPGILHECVNALAIILRQIQRSPA